MPVLHPLYSIQSHPITNKRFPKKFQLYIIWRLHAEAHCQTTYSQFQYLLGKHNSKVHGVPWNKPEKLCILCNKFFSLFTLNAEMEYLLNTHVVLYSFILPYICYTCTPQFVEIFPLHRHAFQTWCILINSNFDWSYIGRGFCCTLRWHMAGGGQKIIHKPS